MAAGGTGPCGYPDLPGAALRRRLLRGAVALPDAAQPPLHAGRRRRHLRRLQGARRQLRRHDRGRHQGLLHHQRAAHARTTTTRSTDLYMWSEATDSHHADLDGGNDGEAGNSDACDGDVRRRSAASTPTPTSLLLPAASEASAATAARTTRSPPRTATSTSSRPSSSTARAGFRTRRTSTSTADGAVAVRHHADRRPVLLHTPRSNFGQRLQRHADRADAGHSRRQPHGLRHRQPGHAVRQRRAPGDVHLRTATRGTIVCVSCIPSGAPPTSDVAGEPGRPLHDRTTAAPSSPPKTRSSTSTPTESQDVYEYVDGRPQLITPGTGDTSVAGGGGRFTGVSSRPGWSASAPTDATSTSRPTTRWSARTTTATSSSSTTPAPAAASRRRAAAALRRRRRVPRRRQRTAGAARRTAPGAALSRRQRGSRQASHGQEEASRSAIARRATSTGRARPGSNEDGGGAR